MATVQDIYSDVILKTYQGDVTDDITLEISHIKFWINKYLNALIVTEINSKKSRSEMIPSIYIKPETCKVGQLEESSCGDGCSDKIFIELEEEPLTINNGWEIISMETDKGDPIRKASPETLNLFKHLRFGKPSEDNLLYSRIDQKIYVEGMKESDIDFDEINVVYIPKQDVTSLSDSDEVKASDLILPELINLLAQEAKLMIYGSQPDEDNDGTTKINPVYHTAIANPSKQDIE